jgi:hypothetical protein
MIFGLRELDRVLRGDTATPILLGPLLRVGLALAAAYGVCMGVYGLFGRDEPEYRQMFASAVKVPALLVLTLAVTFPSLYVFNTLLGSRLRLEELARLLGSAMAVLVAVLAAFGPIVAFFSVTTASYPFILVLNVAFFAVAGTLGLGFLLKHLSRLVQIDHERQIVVAPDEGEPPLAVYDVTPSPTRTVFGVWMGLFVLVGSQMSWVLRPFIGSPTQDFTWLRPRQSSFAEAVWRAVAQLTAGG